MKDKSDRISYVFCIVITIFICACGFFIIKDDSAIIASIKSTEEKSGVEEKSYTHCDEITTYLPDGAINNSFTVYYDSKEVITGNSETRIVYTVNRKDSLGTILVLVVDDGTIYYKSQEDIYNTDDSCFHVFSGTFTICNLE